MIPGRPDTAARRAARAAIVALALLLAGSPARGACAPPASGDDATSPTVATVGETVLTLADLERVERRPGFPRVPGRPPAPEIRARALRQLVNETHLAAEIAARGIEVPDREIDDRLAALVQGLAAQKSSLEQLLAATGLDREGLRRQLRFEAGLQRLTATLRTAELVDEVAEARRREFDGTRVRVSHIVFRPDGSQGNDPIAAILPRARRVRDAIESGQTTFAEAAAAHSAGPSRHRGGDLGFIPRHGVLAEEFASVCFQLDPGAVSEPFRSPLGVHIVTVTEVDEGTVPPERYRAQIEAIASEVALERALKERRVAMPVTLEPGYRMSEPRTLDVKP